MAQADIPGSINYQGRLTDSATGQPLPGGQAIVFRIYDAATDGRLLWSESQTVQADSSGVFSAILGSLTPLDNSFDGPVWLEVEVDGEILAPRREIVSVPYAFHALNSDSLAGHSPASFSLAGHSHDEVYVNVGENSSVTAAMVLPDIVSSIDGVTNDGGNIDLVPGSNISISPNDGANSITIGATGVGDGHSLDADDGSPADVVYVDNAGEVGIGTTSAAAKLDIRGTLNVGTNGTGHDVNFYGTESGSRLFWDQSKMALRAGSDDGTGYWNDANTGEYSMALGFGVKASGQRSIALGYNSLAEQDNAVCIGRLSEAGGINSISIGNGAVTGASSAIAIGRYVEATAPGAMVLGIGEGSSDPLVNDISGSLMIGANGTEPAIFVDDWGKVGIGTTEPTFSLHVSQGIVVGGPGYTGPTPVRLLVNLKGSSLSETPFVIRDSAGDRIVRVDRYGNLALGHSSPLSKLHIQEDDQDLESGALQFEDIIVEDLDAIVGLYSGDAGNAGSAVSFAEMTEGTLTDKWGIIRETTRGGAGGGSGLRFTFGTGSDHFTNPIVMYLDDTGKVGIGTRSFGTELFRVEGTACAAAWNTCSDLKFKENIQDVENALDKVLKLRGVRFNWKRHEYDDRHFPEGSHYGVIAQEAEVVLPEIVSSAPEGERAVAYAEIVPILIESIKELRAENLALLERIEALEVTGE
jgi:hypothetical protein